MNFKNKEEMVRENSNSRSKYYKIRIPIKMRKETSSIIKQEEIRRKKENLLHIYIYMEICFSKIM